MNCKKRIDPFFKNYDLMNKNRNFDKLIHNIIKTFKISNDILNKNHPINNKKKLFNICEPPPYKIKDAKKILSLLKNINIELKNNNKGNCRILWTGWEELTQFVACFIGNKISIKYNYSRTIEQTNITKDWLNSCGTWNKEFDIIKSLLKKYNKNSKENILNNETQKIRKAIWDKYSILFSSYDNLINTIVFIPNNIDKDILKKTLVHLELNNLKTENICIIMISDLNKFIINPHLKDFKIYNLQKSKNIIFEFNKWNMNFKKNFIKFLRKHKGKKITTIKINNTQKKSKSLRKIKRKTKRKTKR